MTGRCPASVQYSRHCCSVRIAPIFSPPLFFLFLSTQAHYARQIWWKANHGQTKICSAPSTFSARLLSPPAQELCFVTCLRKTCPSPRLYVCRNMRPPPCTVVAQRGNPRILGPSHIVQVKSHLIAGVLMIQGSAAPSERAFR